jgi:DNA-3-methyladenine glycosylase II
VSISRPDLSRADIEATLRRDPVLDALLDRDDSAVRVLDGMEGHGGLTAPADAHFTALAYAFTGQQVPERQALRSIAALHARFADRDDPDRLDPAAIAAAGHDGLAEVVGLVLSPRRRGWLVGLAEDVSTGRLDLDALSALPDDDAVLALTAIPGIGPWSAGQYLFWHLRRVDHVPADDPGLRHALADLYHLPDLPDGLTVESITRAWAPYRGIAVKVLLASGVGPGLSPSWPRASPSPGLPAMRRRRDRAVAHAPRRAAV